jgi:hypothetical protein
MEALIMNIFYSCLADTTNRAIPGLAKTISKESSIDFDYLKKIVK